MKTLGFHHVALKVHDVERVGAFYREVLGLAEVRRWFRDDGTLRSIWFATTQRIEDSDGFIAVEAPPLEEPPGTLGYAMVALRIAPDDRERVAAELKARDLPLVRETRWTLYVRDPEGNMVGLSHHPHDAPSG